MIKVRIPTTFLAAGSALILVAALLVSAITASAATAVGLGTAARFAVLAGAGITNTGPSVINGDIGSFPTTSISGFPPGIVIGTIRAGDAVTQGAKNDLTTAYNVAAGQLPVITVATELGGSTLTPGVYVSSSGTFGITGTLTLDGQGDPNAVFIFKTATTLITAAGSRVLLINGTQSCNVFWQVGSSATLGAGTSFLGTILALTSISLVTGATIDGRALAQNGAVTLDTNVITVPMCVVVATPTPVVATPTPVVATPTPVVATPTPLGATPTPIGATPTPLAPTPLGPTPTPLVATALLPPAIAPILAPASTAVAATDTAPQSAVASDLAGNVATVPTSPDVNSVLGSEAAPIAGSVAAPIAASQASPASPASPVSRQSGASGLPATSTAAGAEGLGLAIVGLGLALLRRRQTTR